LPLALSLSSICQLFLLVSFLKKKTKILDFRKIYSSFFKILVSTVLMAILVYLTLQISALFLATNKVSGIFLQIFFAAVVGIFSYGFFSLFLKCEEPKIIWQSILTQFKK